jgi:hypothetical protein
MPSSGPQIAFSLYGSLKGDNFKGCGKSTYINSFYTTTGFTAFSDALTSAGISNTGDNYYTYCASGSGLGCQHGGTGFVLVTYDSGTCGYGTAVGTIPSALATFNKVLNSATCVPIYTNDGDNSNDNGLTLLYNAEACTVGDFAGACPDPFYKKTQYEWTMARALLGSNAADLFHKEVWLGTALLLLGILFAVASMCIIVYEKWIKPCLRRGQHAGEPDSDGLIKDGGLLKVARSSRRSRGKKNKPEATPKDDESVVSKFAARVSNGFNRILDRATDRMESTVDDVHCGPMDGHYRESSRKSGFAARSDVATVGSVDTEQGIYNEDIDASRMRLKKISDMEANASNLSEASYTKQSLRNSMSNRSASLKRMTGGSTSPTPMNDQNLIDLTHANTNSDMQPDDIPTSPSKNGVGSMASHKSIEVTIPRGGFDAPPAQPRTEADTVDSTPRRNPREQVNRLLSKYRNARHD